MIQLHIFSGKKAGAQSVARRFPFRIGRAAQNDLQLEDAGIWDQHLMLEFQLNEGFTLAAAPEAIVAVNGQSVQKTVLRNGDIITLGSVKIQFWLAAAQQRGLRIREGLVWALLAMVALGQFALIYWFLG
jgi:pSer/pThr/pTyr-binding forkhead associated (FHA) protein